MNINNVVFERSFGTSSQLPASTLPEIAFAGRSNVGKSSLLNKLFNRKGLAKVSQTPGKTATINFFSCDSVRFVDLPGYGYAKVSKSEKERWAELIEGYFAQERNLALVVSLVDIRHAVSALDEGMVGFLREAGLPFAVALTKADKLSRQQQAKQKSAIVRQLGLATDVPTVVCSSEKGTGIDELRALVTTAAS
ncbi:YihA family ribosome biogenesis GTP-binding protein [Gordonibacter sp. An230]|uniref:ribosome biogenesis GTP-binding protein YihA/YsxC n=1 Tax=Gordonibacter sp. An230 TaxID=1965592 RepID=UPI000B38B673|nr:ribosome biogenesis GTP-binding protein YihA/YsxC [Gordonibacter sp. An230]OUO87014.1 YihA family ribosome biogenesis GTP-binding protein [Gordonibacter sp. An230]